MIDIVLKLYLALLALGVLSVIRMLWHGSTWFLVQRQEDQMEHELNLLRLRIELAKAKREEPCESQPS